MDPKQISGSAVGQVIKYDSTAGKNIWKDDVGAIGLNIEGAGIADITTGFKKFLIIPFDCVVTGWQIIASTSGNVVIDVWKNASAVPTLTDTIAGSEKPTLSSSSSNSDTNLTTWTTSISAGSVIGFNVDSCSGINKLSLIIKLKKI